MYNACEDAFKTLKCGQMEDNHSYTFHKDYLGDVNPQLRVYVGCATQLYGDLNDVQLIKAHIRSGKVSLMRYDNWQLDVPHLTTRVKIRLRDLEIDFFDHTDEVQGLMDKSAYTR